MQRLLKKGPVLIGVIVLAGGVGGWQWHLRNEHGVVFTTATVKRGDLVATITATGTIEPVEVIDVGAQVAGLIKSFGKDKNGNAIDYGSMIEEGTILATIDESVYTADLSLAKAQVEQDQAGELRAAADVEQMKAKAAQSEADWNRAQELSRSKLISQADNDSYRANYESARANVAVGKAALTQAQAATVQARALLEKAQRNLDFCTIKSPVKGVIIDRRVNIGQTVVASLNAPSLFLIAKDLTKMQIWVSVNEADVGKIVPGTPVTFTCDTFPDREFTGTVGKVRLNATMAQNVVMYTVEVNIENVDKTLLPYLTANVRFIVRKEADALLVPNVALRWLPSTTLQIAPDLRSSKVVADLRADPPNASDSSKPGKASNRHLGVLWLKDGDFARPLEVTVGISDGANTAVSSDLLHEGQEVVTGEVVENAQAGTKNPFLPVFRRR